MRKQTTKPKRRDIFGELISGVTAMRAHRKGQLTLREHRVEPLHLPRVNAEMVRATRRQLSMSRAVFADRLGFNLRTIERWEQGRRSIETGGSSASVLATRDWLDPMRAASPA